MDPLNIVVWGIIGAVAGLVISLLTRDQTSGSMAMDVIIGLIGGVVGGFVLRVLNVVGDAQLTGAIHLPSALVAIVGGLLVVGVVEYLRHSNQ